MKSGTVGAAFDVNTTNTVRRRLDGRPAMKGTP